MLSRDIEKFLNQSLNSGAFEVYALAGDASARRYFRVVSGDMSYVLMLWEPFVDDGNYPFLSVLRHFAKNDISVPTVIALGPELGVALLEDLGDLTLERRFEERENREHWMPFYRQAIDEIAGIHHKATADRSPCTAFEIKFDREKFLWEMNFALNHFLYELAGLELPASSRADLQKIFADICERLDNLPKHIAHRDYHSRNLMIKLNKVKVIDFQDARMGPIQYDLVSLLRDSYVQIDEESERELLNYYFEQNCVPVLPV